MIDFAPLLQPDRGGPAHAVHLVDKDSFAHWLKRQSAARRALLDAVGARTFALENGALRSYEGGWAEYVRVREERREAQASALTAAKQERRAAAKPTRNGRTARRGPSKNAQARIADLEREVERAEAALAAIEDELADPAMWSSPSRTERSTARHTAARKAVAEAYARWEQASAGV